jgi:hypothetical protein
MISATTSSKPTESNDKLHTITMAPSRVRDDQEEDSAAYPSSESGPTRFYPNPFLYVLSPESESSSSSNSNTPQKLPYVDSKFKPLDSEEEEKTNFVDLVSLLYKSASKGTDDATNLKEVETKDKHPAEGSKEQQNDTTKDTTTITIDELMSILVNRLTKISLKIRETVDPTHTVTSPPMSSPHLIKKIEKSLFNVHSGYAGIALYFLKLHSCQFDHQFGIPSHASNPLTLASLYIEKALSILYVSAHHSHGIGHKDHCVGFIVSTSGVYAVAIGVYDALNDMDNRDKMLDSLLHLQKNVFSTHTSNDLFNGRAG